MPTFAPNYQAVATAKFTVKPAGLLSFAELYLVQDSVTIATSGLREFNSTGLQQSIKFPIPMPSTPGTYKVFLDIVAADILVGEYQGIEDVVITPVEVTKYAMSVGTPAQVPTGTYFNATFYVDIPQAAAGELHLVTARLQGPGQGPTIGPLEFTKAGTTIVTKQMRAIDWWTDAPLPPGLYKIETQFWKEGVMFIWKWSPIGTIEII